MIGGCLRLLCHHFNGVGEGLGREMEVLEMMCQCWLLAETLAWRREDQEPMAREMHLRRELYFHQSLWIETWSSTFLEHCLVHRNPGAQPTSTPSKSLPFRFCIPMRPSSSQASSLFVLSLPRPTHFELLVELFYGVA